MTSRWRHMLSNRHKPSDQVTKLCLPYTCLSIYPCMRNQFTCARVCPCTCLLPVHMFAHPCTHLSSPAYPCTYLPICLWSRSLVNLYTYVCNVDMLTCPCSRVHMPHVHVIGLDTNQVTKWLTDQVASARAPIWLFTLAYITRLPVHLFDRAPVCCMCTRLLTVYTFAFTHLPVHMFTHLHVHPFTCKSIHPGM